MQDARGTVPEIPFKYNSDVSSSTSNPSIPKDIATILQENNEDQYYTVNGRIIIGTGPIKINNNRQRSKKDKVIIDSSEEAVPLTLWNNLWEELDSGDVVSLTNLKLKHFREKTFLTISPTTVKMHTLKRKMLHPCRKCPKNLSQTSVTVNVSELEVGQADKFSTCQSCRKSGRIKYKVKVLCMPNLQKKSTHRETGIYLSDTTINESRGHRYRGIVVTGNCRNHLKICSEDELMDVFLEGSNFSIKYNIDNNMVLSIQVA